MNYAGRCLTSVYIHAHLSGTAVLVGCTPLSIAGLLYDIVLEILQDALIISTLQKKKQFVTYS